MASQATSFKPYHAKRKVLMCNYVYVKNYATVCNILQLKIGKEMGANKNRVGTKTKGYGKWEV